MEKIKYQYKKVVIFLFILNVIIVGAIVACNYQNWILAEQILFSFFIACVTGMIIQLLTGIKQEDLQKQTTYQKELEEMRNKILQYRKNLSHLSRKCHRYYFYQEAEKMMTQINSLNEQISYLEEKEKRKNPIRKFIEGQEINLEQKISSCEEIREDIVNQMDQKSILKKMYRYSHKLDKLYYATGRELGIH